MKERKNMEESLYKRIYYNIDDGSVRFSIDVKIKPKYVDDFLYKVLKSKYYWKLLYRISNNPHMSLSKCCKKNKMIFLDFYSSKTISEIRQILMNIGIFSVKINEEDLILDLKNF